MALVDPTTDAPYESIGLYVAFMVVLFLIVVPWLQASVAAFHDDPRSRRQAYARAGRRIHALAGATLVYNVAVLAGLVLLVVPGVVVGARWALYVAVHSVGGRTGLQSLRRSNELVSGRTWPVVRVLGLLLLVSIAAAIPGGALLALDDPFANWAGGTLVDLALATLFGTAAYVLLRQLDEERAA